MELLHNAYSGGEIGEQVSLTVNVIDNDYDPDDPSFDSTPVARVAKSTFIRALGDVGTVPLDASSSSDADGDSVKYAGLDGCRKTTLRVALTTVSLHHLCVWHLSASTGR